MRAAARGGVDARTGFLNTFVVAFFVTDGNLVGRPFEHALTPALIAGRRASSLPHLEPASSESSGSRTPASAGRAGSAAAGAGPASARSGVHSGTTGGSYSGGGVPGGRWRPEQAKKLSPTNPQTTTRVFIKLPQARRRPHRPQRPSRLRHLRLGRSPVRPGPILVLPLRPRLAQGAPRRSPQLAHLVPPEARPPAHMSQAVVPGRRPASGKPGRRPEGKARSKGGAASCPTFLVYRT